MTEEQIRNRIKILAQKRDNETNPGESSLLAKSYQMEIDNLIDILRHKAREAE
jgi:hypothetical protein